MSDSKPIPIVIESADDYGDDYEYDDNDDYGDDYDYDDNDDDEDELAEEGEIVEELKKTDV